MDPFVGYLIGVVATFFIGAFLQGFLGTLGSDELDDIGFLGFCSVFWPITVPMFGIPMVIFLGFSALYDFGKYIGKKLGGN